MAKVAKRRDRWVLDYVDQHGKRRWETMEEGTTRKQADDVLSERLSQVRAGDFQSKRDAMR